MKRCSTVKAIVIIITVTIIDKTSARNLLTSPTNLTSQEQVEEDTIIIENDDLTKEDDYSQFKPPNDMLDFNTDDAKSTETLLDFFNDSREPSLLDLFTEDVDSNENPNQKLNPLNILGNLFNDNEEEEDQSNGFNPIGALANLFKDDDSQNDNSKTFFSFNPGQLLDPLQEKINKWASVLTHPNVGLGFPRPFDGLWNKVQQGASHFLGGGGGFNNAVHGFGQIGGHDYPFPYRHTFKNGVDGGVDDGTGKNGRDLSLKDVVGFAGLKFANRRRRRSVEIGNVNDVKDSGLEIVDSGDAEINDGSEFVKRKRRDVDFDGAMDDSLEIVDARTKREVDIKDSGLVIVDRRSKRNVEVDGEMDDSLIIVNMRKRGVEDDDTIAAKALETINQRKRRYVEIGDTNNIKDSGLEVVDTRKRDVNVDGAINGLVIDDMRRKSVVDYDTIGGKESGLEFIDRMRRDLNLKKNSNEEDNILRTTRDAVDGERPTGTHTLRITEGKDISNYDDTIHKNNNGYKLTEESLNGTLLDPNYETSKVKNTNLYRGRETGNFEMDQDPIEDEVLEEHLIPPRLYDEYNFEDGTLSSKRNQNNKGVLQEYYPRPSTYIQGQEGNNDSYQEIMVRPSNNNQQPEVYYYQRSIDMNQNVNRNQHSEAGIEEANSYLPIVGNYDKGILRTKRGLVPETNSEIAVNNIYSQTKTGDNLRIRNKRDDSIQKNLEDYIKEGNTEDTNQSSKAQSGNNLKEIIITDGRKNINKLENIFLQAKNGNLDEPTEERQDHNLHDENATNTNLSNVEQNINQLKNNAKKFEQALLATGRQTINKHANEENIKQTTEKLKLLLDGRTDRNKIEEILTETRQARNKFQQILESQAELTPRQNQNEAIIINADREKIKQTEAEIKTKLDSAIKGLNFLKAKLEAYRDQYWEKLINNTKNKTSSKGPYNFPFLFNPTLLGNATKPNN